MWTKKVLLNMINEGELSYNYFSQIIKEQVSIEEYKTKIKEKTEIFFESGELKSKFFAICFSGEESEDMLSQWRGYGDDGKGVAIGLSEKILNKTKKRLNLKEDKTRITYKKVEYDTERQKRILNEFWRKQIKQANEDIRNVNIDFEIWLIDSFYKLYAEAIYMKNSFFKEENERRIVFENEENALHNFRGEELFNKMHLEEGKIAIRNENLVEYYDLNISDVIDRLIKKIIIGPKCKLEKEDIQRLLQYNGYKDVEVVWSKGSYR